MARTKSKFRPSDILVATDGVGGTRDGVPITLAPGTKVRGDHFLARLLPELFVPADTPKSEWPQPPAAVETPEPVRRPRQNPTVTGDTPLKDCVVCRAEILQSPVGALKVGAIVHRDDVRVFDALSAFSPLTSYVSLGLVPNE